MKLTQEEIQHGNKYQKRVSEEIKKTERKQKREELDRLIIPKQKKYNIPSPKEKMNSFKFYISIGMELKGENKMSDFIKKLPNPTALLLYLLRYEPYKIKNHYTVELCNEKGIVASSKTSAIGDRKEMSEALGVSIRVINKWLNKLIEKDIIRKIDNPYYPDTDHYGKYLYKLGVVIDDRVCYYYAG